MTGTEESDWSGPGEPLAFDDEPLEAILYGESAAGPTPADLFAESRPRIEAIRAAIASGRDAEALGAMRALHAQGLPIPEASAREFLGLIERCVPLTPCALAVDHGVPYEGILQPLFDDAVARDSEPLASRAGLLLSFWYEACARYGDGRAVLTTLLARAQRRHTLGDEAGFANNLGYIYLLEGDWDQAEPLFRHAVALVERQGDAARAVNMRANVLTCRFGRVGLPAAEALESEIEAVRETLARHNDWRERKLLVLQARILEHRGELEHAVERMDRAVHCTNGVPSRLRLEDEAYRARLQDRLAGECATARTGGAHDQPDSPSAG